jgi:hypothetical protein
MEPALDDTLLLSVVLVTADSYAPLRRVIAAYRAQTMCHALELVIVAPSAAALAPDGADLADFGAWQVVETGPITALALARAAGVQHCRAPIIALGEDHCFPAPDWAAALLDAHRQPWAAVGPAFANANPTRPLSWANLFMEYGPHLVPIASHVSLDLPGHNSSYKREVLLAYGDRLAAVMEAETVLHADLRAQGRQLFLNSAARVYHTNMTRLGPALETAHVYGRIFAAARARGWPLGRRLMYIAGAALIPWVRLRRTLAEVRRTGRQALLPGLLAPLLLLLFANGLGELLGYAAGEGGARRALLRLELRRMNFLAPGDQLLDQWT